MPVRRAIFRHALLAFAFALSYVLLSRPEVIVIAHLGSVTWYPAVGVLLALMLAVSPWYAPIVCVADALAGVLVYHQPIASYTTTIGSVGVATCYAAAAYVLRGSLPIDLGLRKRQDVVRYVSVTSFAAAASTLIGVACLAADHSILWSQYWSSTPGWFLGDQIGLLAVAPSLLIYVFPWVRRHVLGIVDTSSQKGDPQKTAPTLWSVLEAIAQGLAVLGVLWIMFGHEFGGLQLFYLSYLPILWIAMRHGIRRAVIGVLALNCGIVIALHFSPLTSALLSKTILLMFVVSATGLIVGSAVSERRRIALDLHEQSAYLNSLIRSSPLGIVVLDQDGRIELTNDAFGKLFLYEQGELVSKDLRNIFPSDPETGEVSQMPELFLGRQSTQKTVRRRRRDGQVLDLELNTVPVVENDGVRGAFTIYKDISAQIKAADRERQHAESLGHLIAELEMRTKEMTLLNEMGNLLECCATIEEATSVVVRSVQKLFPDATSGSLYMFRSSRNVLETAANWGATGASETLFPPEACWALRRGQPHWSGNLDGEIICSHLIKPHSAHSLCVPMVGQGDTLGILHLQFLADVDAQPDTNPDNFRNPRQMLATTIAAQIALSLANLRLRETLRDQSIRDPLTGLFNRRFMQESLIRELDRARRRKQPLSLLFVDLDHFKRFNDTFGHDAGDFVLRKLADVVRGFFRSDDVVCRYGGEEFAFILPESSAEDSARRANDLRIKVKDLKLEYHDKWLGSVTLSIGIATFPENGSGYDELLKVADQCLYQSKAAGRDRVTVAGAHQSSGVLQS